MGSVEFQPAGGFPPPVEFTPTPAPKPLPRPAKVELKQLERPEFEPLSKPNAEEQIAQLNKVMEGIGGRLEFGLFEGSDDFFVQVIDREGGNVIKMMPPEHLLELRSKIRDAVGVILDQTQ